MMLFHTAEMSVPPSVIYGEEDQSTEGTPAVLSAFHTSGTSLTLPPAKTYIRCLLLLKVCSRQKSMEVGEVPFEVLGINLPAENEV